MFSLANRFQTVSEGVLSAWFHTKSLVPKQLFVQVDKLAAG